MDDRPEPRRRGWLWKLPLFTALAVLGGVAVVLWTQHDRLMSDQRELHLIETEPPVMAVFEGWEEDDEGTGLYPWVRPIWEEVYLELSRQPGLELLEPGDFLEIVLDPEWENYAIPTYARDHLVARFGLYPRMLSDAEMVAYQLTVPLNWLQGAGIGVLMLGVVALREGLSRWVSRRQPRRVFGAASQPGRDARGASTLPDSRDIPIGLLCLSLAVGLALVAVVTSESANPWSSMAAAVWFVAFSVSAIYLLMRRRHPTLAVVTPYVYLVGILVLVGWSQARPEDLVGSRLPTTDAVRTAGLVFGAGVLAVAVWSAVRGARSRSQAGDDGLAGPSLFSLTPGGYDRSGVDDLLARVAELPATPEGRQAVRNLIENTRFQVAPAAGYNPVEVDQHLDQLLGRLTEGE